MTMPDASIHSYYLSAGLIMAIITMMYLIKKTSKKTVLTKKPITVDHFSEKLAELHKQLEDTRSAILGTHRNNLQKENDALDRAISNQRSHNVFMAEKLLDFKRNPNLMKSYRVLPKDQNDLFDYLLTNTRTK